MKKLSLALLGATALAFTGGAQAADLPVKAAPVVQQPISGYLGSYIGLNTWDYNSYGSGSNAVFGGEGRVNWWLDRNWALQSDLEAEVTNGENTYNTSTYEGRWNTLLGTHLAWRDPSRYALGGFIAGEAHGGSYYGYSASHGFIYGAEGQYYLNNLTLYGQVGGYARISQNTPSSSHYDTPENGWFIRGVGRYFFTPNDKLQAEIGWFDGRNDYQSTRQYVLNWGALWEHKFDMKPLSVYFEYAGFRLTDSNYPSDTYAWTNHAFMFGAKLYLNQPTLLANDRNGATFDLPKFPKALPYGYEVAF
jgi:hypothetical protein